jgi:hypothetical protein
MVNLKSPTGIGLKMVLVAGAHYWTQAQPDRAAALRFIKTLSHIGISSSFIFVVILFAIF